MSQHFLLSAKAKTLSLSAVLRMTDEEAEAAFIRIRWAATGGKPVRMRDRVGLPEGERNRPLALQGLPEELQRHVGYDLCPPQAEAPRLPRRHCDLLQ